MIEVASIQYQIGVYDLCKGGVTLNLDEAIMYAAKQGLLRVGWVILNGE